MVEPVTLQVSCPECGGAVTLLVADWAKRSPAPTHFAVGHDAEWECPYCQQANAATRPGRVVWVTKGHDHRTASVTIASQQHPANIKAGDVVIRIKAGVAIRAYAFVEQDGVVPPSGQWKVGGGSGVEAWAANRTQITGGTIHCLLE